MIRSEQIEFVRGLSSTIADKIIEAIQAGKIPEDWDGHELRILLSNQHAQSASMSTIYAHPQSKRARDFRNFMNTNSCGF